MLELIFTPEAEADVSTAFNWYEVQQTGLGIDFLSKVDDACNTICDGPHRLAVLFRGIRRLPINRFPYGVFYVIGNSAIHVIAVLHNRRNPAVWRSRNP